MKQQSPRPEATTGIQPDAANRTHLSSTPGPCSAAAAESKLHLPRMYALSRRDDCVQSAGPTPPFLSRAKNRLTRSPSPRKSPHNIRQRAELTALPRLFLKLPPSLASDPTGSPHPTLALFLPARLCTRKQNLPPSLALDPSIPRSLSKSSSSSSREKWETRRFASSSPNWSQRRDGTGCQSARFPAPSATSTSLREHDAAPREKLNVCRARIFSPAPAAAVVAAAARLGSSVRPLYHGPRQSSGTTTAVRSLAPSHNFPPSTDIAIASASGMLRTCFGCGSEAMSAHRCAQHFSARRRFLRSDDSRTAGPSKETVSRPLISIGY